MTNKKAMQITQKKIMQCAEKTFRKWAKKWPELENDKILKNALECSYMRGFYDAIESMDSLISYHERFS